MGSGTLLPLVVGGQAEPSVSERLSLGFDIVTFSGDKLLGGAQAGIIAGKAEYIAKMKKHPLLRAIRIDKLSLAALEGTLMDYTLGQPLRDIPVLAMLSVSADELRERAELLNNLMVKTNLPGLAAEVISVNSPAGGGALPAAVLAGYGVAVHLAGRRAAEVESGLRQREIPIIARIQEDRVILDVRCLVEQDFAEIATALCEIGRLEL